MGISGNTVEIDVSNWPRSPAEAALFAARTRAEQKTALDELAVFYSRPEFRGHDPISMVWAHEARQDRELTTLLAAGMAYGRVAAILGGLQDIASRWGPSPAAFTLSSTEDQIRTSMDGFVYRWTRGEQVSNMLIAWKRYVEAGGDLEATVAKHSLPEVGGARFGVAALICELERCSPGAFGGLLPKSDGGSAMKRVAMGLRWLVRQDCIDPGGWTLVSPRQLWVPLDTHMFALGRKLRFTRRKSPSLAAAMDITRVLARMDPDDPVRYDFALTRLGILS